MYSPLFISVYQVLRGCESFIVYGKVRNFSRTFSINICMQPFVHEHQLESVLIHHPPLIAKMCNNAKELFLHNERYCTRIRNRIYGGAACGRFLAQRKNSACDIGNAVFPNPIRLPSSENRALKINGSKRVTLKRCR